MSTAGAPTRSQVMEVVSRYWGFDALRPIQEQAVRAALRGRDSLVVMPTGGGKSLCYQVPPLVTGRLGVVVSPLIALMKDQVDGLRLAGVPAAAIHSGLSAEEAAEAEAALSAGELRLLFVAPERLLMRGFLSKLREAGVASFAIDEAHCISQWGHDFRPEYRRLAEVREVFPGAGFHAFTATATKQVQDDIVAQLRLREPEILVGPFDRPNLTYRILPRQRADQQCAEIIARHSSGEHAGATIIYCLSRQNTEDLAAALGGRGISAQAYHAGLEPKKRRRVQDDFASERLDVVVATVAFGMGIDRSNVRCVIHATMPKSVEHYQQETGRAGRDGLSAECILLYSPGDAVRWQKMMRDAADQSGGGGPDDQALRIQLALVDRMQKFAASATCRHRALAEYFGQPYPNTDAPPQDAAQGCSACDICLQERAAAADSTTIARKILSCVYRAEQRFGPSHITQVLRGQRTQKILDWRHDELSTFGLLRDTPRHAIMSYIDQLTSQGFLILAGDPYPVLRLTPESLPVLKGEQEVSLVEPPMGSAGRAKRERQPAGGGSDPLSADELAVFESLRTLRLNIARERNIPPYVVFHDSTLREIARQRPATLAELARIKGVGERKVAEFGDAVLEVVR